MQSGSMDWLFFKWEVRVVLVACWCCFMEFGIEFYCLLWRCFMEFGIAFNCLLAFFMEFVIANGKLRRDAWLARMYKGGLINLELKYLGTCLHACDNFTVAHMQCAALKSIWTIGGLHYWTLSSSSSGSRGYNLLGIATGGARHRPTAVVAAPSRPTRASVGRRQVSIRHL